MSNFPSPNRFNPSPLTTDHQANVQLESRRRLTLKSPISSINISTEIVKQSQNQDAGASHSIQDTPTEAMSYVQKSLESLKNALETLEKQSDTTLYSDGRTSESEHPLSKLVQLLWPTHLDDVARGTVDRHMAKIIDFARVIRTASDFALVGYVASKAASKQTLLASTTGNAVNATAISNIRSELNRIYTSSAPLIQTAAVLRRSIGELRADARKNRNDIARQHSDALGTTAAVARTSEMQKFILAFSTVPMLLTLASFAIGVQDSPQSMAYKTTGGIAAFIGVLQGQIGQWISSLKKGDTEYVKKAFELLSQLVSGLEKLEGVVSGYEGVLTEMRTLLTSDFFLAGNLHPHSVVVWGFIEEKFRVLHEQGEKAREFLDHYKITSVDAPILVDLASDAIAATELGL